MFVLWYCHKRGREVRLAQEAAGGDIGDDERFEELPDDPALPAPSAETQGESSAGPSIKKNA